MSQRWAELFCYTRRKNAGWQQSTFLEPFLGLFRWAFRTTPDRNFPFRKAPSEQTPTICIRAPLVLSPRPIFPVLPSSWSHFSSAFAILSWDAPTERINERARRDISLGKHAQRDISPLSIGWPNFHESIFPLRCVSHPFHDGKIMTEANIQLNKVDSPGTTFSVVLAFAV